MANRFGGVGPGPKMAGKRKFRPTPNLGVKNHRVGYSGGPGAVAYPGRPQPMAGGPTAWQQNAPWLLSGMISNIGYSLDSQKGKGMYWA